MRIIPAIDIIDGKCVRLSQGDYNTKKIYNESPLEVAKQFEANGIKDLHLVDLDGAKSSGIVNWRVLADITTKTNLKVDFGGGIKQDDDLRIAFENGASQITGGSIAVKDRNLFLTWLKTYGANKIILGADAKAGKIAINGWKDETSQHLTDFVTSYCAEGVSYVICTDISKDGMLQGAATDLYRNLIQNNPTIKLIASGGVSCLADLDELRTLGCEGAIIGKAIYENRINLKDLKNYVD